MAHLWGKGSPRMQQARRPRHRKTQHQGLVWGQASLAAVLRLIAEV